MKSLALVTSFVLASLVAELSLNAQVLDYTRLTSLWRLDNNASDGMGVNNGTLMGEAVFEAGPKDSMGSALLSNGTYIKAGKGIAFDTNTAFSATAWIKGPLQNSAIVGRMVQGGTYTGWEFHVGDRPGVLNVWFINAFGPNYIDVHGSTPVLDEAWHHVAMTYDGSGTASGIKLYVDGMEDPMEISADTLTGTMVAADAEFCLGTRQSGANHTLQGSLSEVSLWSAALTAAQITTIFQDGIHPPMTFTASAPETFAGVPVTLAWEAEPGATLTITPGVGDVTSVSTNGKGSVQVAPEEATTYTLTAVKGASEQTKQVGIAIKPMIVSFTASNSQVPKGVSVALSWVVHPHAQLTLTPALGDAGAATTNGIGGLQATPGQTTVYVLRAQRGSVFAEASATVQVAESTQPDFSDLLSLWRLNQDVADSAGTNDGLYFGLGEQYVEGPRTNAGGLYFDGYTWLAAGQGVAFDTATPFSATAWVNGPFEQDSAIIGRMRQGNGYTGWELHVGTDAGGSARGRLNVWLINSFGASHIQVNSPVTVLDETWHHVAFTYDGSGKAAGVKIYVDGLDATGPATADNLAGTVLAEDAELNLGSRQNGTIHNFTGSLSEVSVWNMTLSLANILYLYKEGVPNPLPPPTLRVTGGKFTTPSTFQFSWESVVGKSYRVEVSPDLKNWTVASESYPAGGATATKTVFTDNTASGNAQYYRVRPRS